MVSYEIAIGLIILSVLVTAGSLNLSDIVRAQEGMVLHPPLPDVHDLHRLDPGRDQPAPVRPARGRGDAGDRLQRRVQLDDVRAVLPRRVRQHDLDERHHLGAVPRRLGSPVRRLPSLIPGPIWFILKICFVAFIFFWARATLPRYRYDQLMQLGWKVFLPASLLWVVLTAGLPRGLRPAAALAAATRPPESPTWRPSTAWPARCSGRSW